MVGQSRHRHPDAGRQLRAARARGRVPFRERHRRHGTGAARPTRINRWLINASSQYVTLRPGGSYMSHSDSFALVRGGHLDLCVLGAFQVAENGDLANWARSEDDNAPAIGGAMDLAAGAKRIWIVMEHNTRSGEARLLRRCTYPLTAAGCVKRVYTELAVIDVTERGFVVTDMVPGLTIEELQERTGAPLLRAGIVTDAFSEI